MRPVGTTPRRSTPLTALMVVGTLWMIVGLSGVVAADASRGGLTVMTEPEGASVYVDGELHGTTPLQIEDLSPGDHRIRVVKPGYLENSRVVAIGGGLGSELRVMLTPVVPNASGPAGQDALTDEKATGSKTKKILLVGAGVAAAGTGAYLLLRDTNDAPSPGTVMVSPSVALASVTRVDFTVSGASDPDGDSLSYTWNLGDGASAMGQSVSHVYESDGTYPVTLTVSDGELSSTTTASVAVRNLTGRWTGSYSVGRRFTVDLSQSGTNLSGSWRANWDPSRTDSLSGSISQPDRVRLDFAFFCDIWEMELDDTFNEMNGTATCPDSSYRFGVTMRR